MSGLSFCLRRVPLGPGLVALLWLSGCVLLDSSGSVSDSSGSVSDSSGSVATSSESSSDSSTSSSGDDDQAYHEDIRSFTIAIVRLDGSPDELRRGLAEIALGRGTRVRLARDPLPVVPIARDRSRLRPPDRAMKSGVQCSGCVDDQPSSSERCSIHSSSWLR